MGIWIENIPERHDRPYRLGRNVEHDTRNRGFSWPWSKPQGVTVFWSDSGPILNQGSIGSCTGDTVADVLNTDMFTPVRKAKNDSTYFDQDQAYNIYSLSTHISATGGGQEWPPNDVGSSGPAAAEAGEHLGYFDKYQHCFTIDQAIAALETQPVMFGTIWTNDMFDYDNDGVISIGSLDESNQVGGHEFMGRGFNNTTGLILCRNHWYEQDNVTLWNPTTNGAKLPGEFWIHKDDMAALLAQQGDVTVPHGVGLP